MHVRLFLLHTGSTWLLHTFEYVRFVWYDGTGKSIGITDGILKVESDFIERSRRSMSQRFLVAAPESAVSVLVELGLGRSGLATSRVVLPPRSAD
jgi:hypothetical protein